ncbi:hypothetical protein CYMTET_51806 [Cymbomonas tetramitiformis]|uniref:Aldose 1-epimerase n=1 Tax=Cymbomonas tetramitiformis TaxID=36881 RepID=A0AAE0ETB5_9CHLO|nr:hypothetical protein CYMTET_51806 [Cymbomonas tetramitiformis]
MKHSGYIAILSAGGAALAALAVYTGIVTKKRDETPFVLSGGGITVHISPFGATILKLLAPDRHGKVDDIVLGFDDLVPYKTGVSPYFGCIVGRVANRIAKATFSLGGKTYKLNANNGENTLHGGLVGFDKVWWDAEDVSEPGTPALRLTYTSRDGEEGFPGTVQATVTYAIETGSSGEASLVTKMTATTDRATPISMAQHTYWNLAGHASGPVLDHVLRIASTRYTPVDSALIPTGKLVEVKGTPFDFQHPKRIGEHLAQVEGGYDHNYVLANPAGSLPPGVGEELLPPRLAASVHDPRSGRAMDLLTDAPGVQFYSGNFLSQIKGKAANTGGGVMMTSTVYDKHHGFCLETQGFPNAINEPSFPNAVLTPGDIYDHTMIHRFYTR